MEHFTFELEDLRGVFRLFIDEQEIGRIAFRYQKENGISVYQTSVEKEYQGKGYGKKLVQKVLDYAHENELNLTASCWFADKITQEYYSNE